MPNRLADETSPYLLQHQHNPVAWYPWGEEALTRAKAENKPIFLSIGYSACHWCHVMEHESFEDAEIAAKMNELYVCIKVDREERPDLDQIYMNAVQLMTGRGGWPMSVFLTPDLQPFFGGTYWPPRARMGMPGFDLVLERVAEAWQNRREAAIQQAAELTAVLQNIGEQETATEGLRLDLLFAAETKLERAFDFTHGGFGSAPKFPHSMDLQLLLRMNKRRPREIVQQMVTLSLQKMADGGIYDHLGGGFARYSVDERWLVPHFEKMLYDNALLTTAYLEAYQVTGDAYFANVARETCDYVLRDMLDEAGGFHSSEDADSEGVEGKFYVWTPAEIITVLGADRGAKFCDVYDVSSAGNFEHGLSILHLPKSVAQCAAQHGWDVNVLARELAEDRQKLLAVRAQRIRPGKDDKILVSWNGLMIDALARAGAVLAEHRYVAAAEKAANFLLTQLRQPESLRLLHCWRQGLAKIDAYLDDYANLTNALVTLYETTGREKYVTAVVEFAEIILQHFGDPNGNGFFYTADDQEQLIARNKDVHDSSIPSGNGMAAMALLRLGKLTGRSEFTQGGVGALENAAHVMERSPTAAGQLLLALDFYFGPTPEIVVLGEASCSPTEELLREFHSQFIPNRVLACRGNSHEPQSPALAPLFEGKVAGDDQPTVYVCQNFACLAPLQGADEVRGLWRRLATER